MSEVEARAATLFKSVSSGVTMVKKNEAWAAITEAVNAVSPEVRTVAQVKKKWFDIKVDAKKRITEQKKKKETGGGQGPPDLTPQDERLAAIIGETSISGICPRTEGESDDIQTNESPRGIS